MEVGVVTRGVAVGLGVGVGLTDADTVATGGGVTVADGVAGTGPAAFGLFAGGVDDFGGVVSCVPVDSAGTETGEGDGLPIPKMKYADAPVAMITATMPIPIRINGSFELEGAVFTDEDIDGDCCCWFGSVVPWGANTGGTVMVVGLVSIAVS